MKEFPTAGTVLNDLRMQFESNFLGIYGNAPFVK
jgi:hypothetical protein